MKNKRYKVIALHFTTDCNLDCPMCYRPKKTNGNKPHDWFKKLIPYLAELTPQVALGGGEPFMFPEFVRDFSKEAKEYGLITNVTTNGTLPMKDYVKDIEMVSVSFDEHKIKTNQDIHNYCLTTRELSKKTRVGCNFLMDNYWLHNPKALLLLLDYFFNSAKIERVFALYPKNWDKLDILKFRALYYAPTFKFKHFYVDDLTNMILTQNKYQGWDKPCHYGKSIVSIDEQGKVYGCSFSNTPLLKLNKPKDILKIPNVKFKERYDCPYLKLK